MRIKSEESLLVAVDFQQKMMPHINGADRVLQKSALLIKGMKALDVPVIVTQQYTRGLGPTEEIICDALGCTDPDKLDYIEKTTFSCFDCEEFRLAIDKSGRRNIILCGVEAHVCLLQTIVDLKQAAYNPIPVLDCISSRREEDYLNGIRRYEAEKAIPSCFESILFELCRDSGSPVFRTISALVKEGP